jgi:hypothetical protein
VGHPGFDILRLTEDLQPDEAATLLESWASRWRRERPHCDPERALLLLRPLASLVAAAAYAGFVTQIEPSERVYHVDDISPYLEKARRLWRRAEPQPRAPTSNSGSQGVALRIRRERSTGV